MIGSYFFAFFSIVLTFLCSGSFASLFISCFTFVIGYFFCATIKQENRNKGVTLFNIVFSCLTVFACVHYMDTVVDWKVFADEGRDEYKFWNITEFVRSYPSLKKLYLDCFIEKNVGGLIENQGYVFYIGFLSWIAEHFFDGNHLLYQFLGTVVFSSLSSVVLYKIFLIYFDAKSSFKHVLIFSLCSVTFYYGFHFLRDISVLFFFLLLTYVFFRKFSVLNLLKMALLSLIIFQLRFEHGLFSILFIAAYVYKQFRKIKLIMPIVALLLVALFFVYFTSDLERALHSMEMYSEMTDNSAFEKQGLSLYIYRLPPIIKEFVIFFYSAISPFPSWHALPNVANVFSFITNAHIMIYELFWTMVFFLAIKWTLLNRKIVKIPMETVLLFIIAILFIILNLSNPSHRRMMSVYPIIYLVYCLIKGKIITKEKVIRDKRLIFSMWTILMILYLFIKFV